MAYLDTSDVFSRISAFPIAPPVDFFPAPPEVASFGHTEWAVIGLARQDTLASLQEPRHSAWRRLLIGKSRAYKLADERLEALRQLAVEAWRTPLAISLRTLGGFIAAGFTNAQLALLLSATGALAAIANSNAATGNSV